MMQWVRNVASMQQLGSLLWQGFDPQPRNFHMPWVGPKKKQRPKKPPHVIFDAHQVLSDGQREGQLGTFSVHLPG